MAQTSGPMTFEKVVEVWNDSTQIFGIWIGTTFVWPDPWTDIWDEGTNVYWETVWHDMWSESYTTEGEGNGDQQLTRVPVPGRDSGR